MMSFNKLLTNDRSIRKILLNDLKTEHGHDQNTAIIPELSLPNGLARIDVAVVNGIMHGYELKGDLDCLNRLPGQIHAYNLIFDKITLVVGKKHVIDAIGIIPEWWGLTIAKDVGSDNDNLLFSLRNPSINPEQDINCIVNLLWKREALELFELTHKTKGIYSKSKDSICREIVETSEKQFIKDFVRKKLVQRFLLRTQELAKS